MYSLIDVLNAVFKLPDNIYNSIVLQLRKAQVGSNITIHGRIFLRGKGQICIGDNVTINSSLQSNPIGGSTRTVIHCISGKIEIGDNVGISNASLVCRSGITIKDWVKIGGNVKIYDNDFHSIDYINRRKAPDMDIKSSPVFIDEDAFIGAHSVILKGVNIGKRSVIAAGSVVTKNVPDDELWGGVPAKFIKNL